jgi:repressor LexA
MNKKSPLPQTSLSALSSTRGIGLTKSTDLVNPIPKQDLARELADSPGVISLTSKEKKVLEFIEDFVIREGLSPSYLEIKDHFSFASFNSVQNYLKQLGRKGYLVVEPHQKRAIQLLKSSNSFSTTGSPRAQLLQARGEVLSLPLLGSVAAGRPLEKLTFNEEIEVPSSLVKNPGETFALRVQGVSMIDEGILDGDLILVQKTPSAQNGDLVVALIESEATVKRFYAHPRNPRVKRVELRPANLQMSSMYFSDEEVQIEGRVVGLIRKF